MSANIVKMTTIQDLAPGASTSRKWNNANATVYKLNAWPIVSPGQTATVEFTRIAYLVHGEPPERELHYTIKNTGTTTVDIDIWAFYWYAPKPIRVRRDVADPLSVDTLYWYGRAVAELSKRPITDPTSWRYQAAIHGYSTLSDPLKVPGEVLPSAADRDKYWNQCQHSSWYFFPWHRMYLHHFEEIVAAAVVSLGGPADWALPYWNYSTSATAARLPPAFRNAVVDGAPNPLYVEDRNPQANAGLDIATSDQTSTTTAMQQTVFFTEGVGTSFGGPKTNFNHSGGSAGTLEVTPHGSMHVRVGGWMSGFNTAGLDPIFWLHHANIDRLWDVWLAQGGGRANPAASTGWTSSVAFAFHDAKGNPVTMSSGDVVNTETLGYRYQETMAGSSALAAKALAVPVTEAPMSNPSELVGATGAPFLLDEQLTHAVVPVPLKERLAKVAARAPATTATPAPQRVFLRIENLTASDRAASYEVYLNLPPGSDPAAHQDHFVGLLPMFGLAESSRSDDHNTGSGLTYDFDVTELVSRLRSQSDWNDQQLQVSFAPSAGERGARVRVGRVSFHVQ